jgi:hypothetical protein
MKNSCFTLVFCVLLVSCGNDTTNQESNKQAATVTASGPSFINPIRVFIPI